MAIVLVRLEVGAFGPLIPGIDKYERFLNRGSFSSLRYEGGQPSFVLLWGGVDKNMGTTTASGRVIPCRHCSPVPNVVRNGLDQLVLNDGGVILEITLEVRMESGERAWVEQSPFGMGRELHRRIKTIRTGVTDTETLDRTKMDLGNPFRGTDCTPSPGGSRRVWNFIYAVHQEHRRSVDADISGVL